MVKELSRARSAGLERWRAPSQTNHRGGLGVGRAYASCLRCESWRSDPGHRAGLCHSGTRRWRRCDEATAVRDRSMESCSDSLLLKVAIKSLNAETESAQRKR